MAIATGSARQIVDVFLVVLLDPVVGGRITGAREAEAGLPRRRWLPMTGRQQQRKGHKEESEPEALHAPSVPTTGLPASRSSQPAGWRTETAPVRARAGCGFATTVIHCHRSGFVWPAEHQRHRSMVDSPRIQSSKRGRGTNGPRSTHFQRVRRGLSWEELLHSIDHDRIFRVVTFDTRFWIEPFTGKRVGLTGDLTATAIAHYKDHDYWKKLPLKSFQEVVYWRWTYFLQSHIKSESRLRFFRQDGSWLNPFNGEWYDSIRRTEGRITAMTLHEMAKVLSSIVEDDIAMMPFEQLRAIIDKANGAGKKATTVPTDVKNVVRGAVPEAESDEAGAGAAVPPADEEAPPAEAEEQHTTSIQEGTPTTGGARTTRARRVQRRLLGELPTVEGLDIGVVYHPQSSVSGDFYEVEQIDETHLLFVLGDVTGHGVQAALTMAMVLKSLRVVARNNLDLIDIATSLHKEVYDDLLEDQFFSAYLGLLDLKRKTLTSLCAGHHPALVVNAGGDILLRRTGKRGAAVGVTRLEPFAKTLAISECELRDGDIVVQYTDGLNEAMSPEEEEYGFNRLYGSCLHHLEGFTNVAGYLESMAGDAMRFAGGEVDDDITVLGFQV